MGTKLWILMGALAMAAPMSHGAVLITMLEVGDDVVASASGTLNLNALSSQATSNYSLTKPIQAFLLAGPRSAAVDSKYYLSASDPLTGPVSFGSGGQTASDEGSGDIVGILGSDHKLCVPDAYVSGADLEGTATWLNHSFTTLGLALGTYTWTWGSGADADSLTVQIGPVPEPAAGTLALLAGAAILGLRRR